MEPHVTVFSLMAILASLQPGTYPQEFPLLADPFLKTWDNYVYKKNAMDSIKKEFYDEAKKHAHALEKGVAFEPPACNVKYGPYWKTENEHISFRRPNLYTHFLISTQPLSNNLFFSIPLKDELVLTLVNEKINKSPQELTETIYDYYSHQFTRIEDHREIIIPNIHIETPLGILSISSEGITINSSARKPQPKEYSERLKNDIPPGLIKEKPILLWISHEKHRNLKTLLFAAYLENAQ